jgi:glutathione synthase
MIKYGLLKKGVTMLRVSEREISKHLSMDQTTGKLFYLDDWEVSVVYFRYSCLPSHFDTPEKWKEREMIEQSRAIKCPDVDLWLSGLKNIQGYFKDAEILKKYLGCSEEQIKEM